MIADRISNLGNYPELAVYKDTVDSFIAKAKAGLPDGRYELDGDRLFALVQHFTTRPLEGALMEGHEHYCDLQCVIEGREAIYVDYAAELTIQEDFRPDGDCFFFALRPPKGMNLIETGTFGYYTPTDAHMPGVMVEGPEDVFKIVFKIKEN